MPAHTLLFAKDSRAGRCQRAAVQDVRTYGRIPAPQPGNHAGFMKGARTS